MQRKFRVLGIRAQLQDVLDWISEVTRERNIDIDDYNNQVAANPTVFTTIPMSSSDLSGAERVGDIAADASYIYIVIDNSGTLEWRRVATSSF